MYIFHELRDGNFRHFCFIRLRNLKQKLLLKLKIAIHFQYVMHYELVNEPNMILILVILTPCKSKVRPRIQIILHFKLIKLVPYTTINYWACH